MFGRELEGYGSCSEDRGPLDGISMDTLVTAEAGGSGTVLVGAAISDLQYESEAQLACVSR